MTTGSLQQIFRHPLKSAGGESLGAASITESGLGGDRAYALIDRMTGKVVSAKRPKLWRAMLLLAAETLPGGEGIAVRFPDGRTVASAGDEFETALSAFLGRPVSLATRRQGGMLLERARPGEVVAEGLDAEVTLDINGLAAETPGPGFQDLAPIHLICTATLEAIAGAAGLPGPEAGRYRPNLVVAMNGAAAFCENDWIGSEVTVGSVRLQVTGPTPRCAIPVLAQGGAGRFRPEVLEAVNRLNRFPVDGHGPLPCAGVYARVVQPGTVRTGDRVGTGEGAQERLSH